MAPAVTEYHDIQAILRSGFGALDGSFLLLRIADRVKARAWLAAVTGAAGVPRLPYQITNAADLKSHQAHALQAAFTAQGLRNLGVPDDLVLAFSREFCIGEVTPEAEREGRPQRLGDIGTNAPSVWEWGSASNVPDVLLLLYAETGELATFKQAVIADLTPAFDVVRTLDTTAVPGDERPRREPFGFIDGISQPEVDWEGRRTAGTRDDIDYGNLIAAGEFLLGYVNEYGFYTQRPLLDPRRDPENLLPQADDAPDRRDLGRNGTYLVLRQLAQDVPGFWRFVSAQSPDDHGVGLAEAMVGRRLRTGDPLAAESSNAIRGVDPKDAQNRFTFDSDPDGLACPFGAHIRRANPRNGDMPGGKKGIVSWLLHTLGLIHGAPRSDALSSSRFHRIIRRGRPYGAAEDHERARKAEYPGSKIGLYFIALNANISRQFEFIQNAWVVSSKFDGLDGESDPLLGSRLSTPLGRPTDAFSRPQVSGPTRRVGGVPQFVTVRGGAYFFLPGLRAIRFFARSGENV